MITNRTKDQQIQKNFSNNFIYTINKEEKTANIIGFMHSKQTISIPRSINHENQEYLITSLSLDTSVYGRSMIENFKFAPDSELRKIEKNSSFTCSITSLTIPSSVTELEDGWCRAAFSLTYVSVMPNNKRYLSIDNNFIIGKSNIENDGYDTFVFACRDIETVSIPNYIETIGPYAFCDCNKLEVVNFPEDSKLKTIEKDAFDNSQIEIITIPSSVTELKEGCFNGMVEVSKVIVMPNNKRYKSIDDKFIVGKSNIENDEYDVFIFACQDVKTVKIPKTIKIIESGAFCGCDELQTIKFSEDSLLHTIKKEAFANSGITSITFPPSISDLNEGWCYLKKMTKVTVMPNNKRYKSIDDKFIVGKSNIENDEYDVFVFACRDVKTVKIPKTIKIIERFAFYDCEQLDIVEFPEDSEFQILKKKSFDGTFLKQLTIPPSVIELEEGCFNGNIKKITVLPNNKRYKSIDDKFIVGKSNIENDEYDIFVFACNDIRTIEIPKTIKIIESGAFDGTKIMELQFPEDSELQIIKERAFSAAHLHKISLPISLQTICKGAFSSCLDLEQVFIPEESKLQTIGKESFCYSTIKEIFIPSQITRINPNTFSNCKLIENVKIPLNSKLQTIGFYSFFSSSIVSIVLPPHLKIIEEGAFADCTSLRYFEIPENSQLETIEADAFASTLINSLVFPQSLIELKEGWCNNLINLTKVTVMPNNRRYASFEDKIIIGKSDIENEEYDVLVYACCDVKTVTLPKCFKIIESYAFYYCTQLQTVKFLDDSRLEIIKKYAFFNSSIEYIKIPNHLKTICEYAFALCKKLRNVEIPSTSELQTIELGAFAYSGIENISIPAQITTIKEGAFCNCENLTKVEIPFNSKLQKLEEDTFSQSSIENFTIPSHVKTLGECCFEDCDKLVNIEIQENSELRMIENELFANSAIESICIPPSVTDLTENCFKGANSLKKITVMPNNKRYLSINDKFIVGKSKIENENFDIFIFACKDVKTITFPKTIKIIEQYALHSCKKLKTVKFPFDSELEIIKKKSFKRSSISEISFPVHLKIICEKAFSDCSNLVKVEFASNCELQKIELRAFSNTGIKSISIPQNLTTICKRAFDNCKMLQSVAIPKNSKLTNIEKYVFLGSKICSLFIPAHPTYFLKKAFTDCDHLGIIEIDEDCELKHINKNTFALKANVIIMIPVKLKDRVEQKDD